MRKSLNLKKSLNGIIDNQSKAVFEKNDFGLCKFEMIISREKIEIVTIDNGNECGYGNGIVSDGVYNLVSRKLPILNEE